MKDMHENYYNYNYNRQYILDTATKSKDYTLIMGDWNVLVGEGKEKRHMGHYGLGSRNGCGGKLA